MIDFEGSWVIICLLLSLRIITVITLVLGWLFLRHFKVRAIYILLGGLRLVRLNCLVRTWFIKQWRS